MTFAENPRGPEPANIYIQSSLLSVPQSLLITVISYILFSTNT